MAGTLDSGCSGLGLSPGPLTNSKLGQPCKELEKNKGGEEEVNISPRRLFIQKPKIIAFCFDTPWVLEGIFFDT